MEPCRVSRVHRHMGTVIRLADVLQDRDSLRQQQVLDSLRRLATPRPDDGAARIEYYRHKAAELREMAEDGILFEARQTLLSLADSYEYMADTLATVGNLREE